MTKRKKKHFLTKIAAELPIWCPVFNSHMLSCGAFISGVYGLFKAKDRSTFAPHIPVARWSLYPCIASYKKLSSYIRAWILGYFVFQTR